jgi:ribosomal protein L15
MTEDKKEQLKLHNLTPARGSKKKKIRVGRGEGGRRGKTAGRGTKGLKARSKLRPGFEGGQTPLAMRLPKLKGFTNPNKEYFAIVNLSSFEGFDAGSEVTPDSLRGMFSGPKKEGNTSANALRYRPTRVASGTSPSNRTCAETPRSRA